jgi:chemotaxis protein CheD
MFTSQGPFLIGEQNAQAARNQLKQFKIPILAEHVAGSNGRRVTLDCDSGLLTIEVVGQSATII